MDPVIVGSLIAAGASLVDNLFTSKANHSSYSHQNQMLDKQLQFNHNEAQWQRDFTSKTIQSAREYNDPSAAMSRLTSAGLNPNLVAGNSSAAGISEASTGGNNNASAPALSAPQVDALSVGSAAQIAKTIAETRNIEQDTSKSEAETSILWNERKWMDALKSKNLETQDSTIQLNKALTVTEGDKQKMLQGQVRAFDQQIRESNQKIKESRARILQLNEETRKAKIDNQFKSSEYKARIAKLWSDIRYQSGMLSVSQGQLNLAFQMAVYQAADLEASAEMKRAMSSVPPAQRTLFESLAARAKSETDKIDFDLSQERSWQDLERSLNFGRGVVGLFSDVQSFLFRPIELAGDTFKSVAPFLGR